MTEANEIDRVEEIDEIVEVKDEDGNDTTDWKALAQKNHGIAQRYKTKFEKAKETKPPVTETKVETKVEKKGFDYAEKAFLKSSGIQADEFDFVDEVMKSTGKSLDEVLEAKYFQTELKERRELKATKDAIPNGSKRSTTTARDTVEYWISKGELPPADQRELRQKVVNARIKAESNKSVFSNNPVV